MLVYKRGKLFYLNGLLFIFFISFSQLVIAGSSVASPDLIISPKTQNKLLSDKTVLTVGFSETDYPPYNFDKDGIYQGFAIDIFRHIESQSSFIFKFVKLPWPRVLQSVKNGEVDLVATLFKTASREELYAYVEPAYGFEVNQFLSLKSNAVEYDGDLRSLSDITIGTVREYSYGKAFDQAEYLDKKAVLDEATLVKVLLGGRVDLIIGNPMTFFHILKQEFKSEAVQMVSPIVERTPVYFALSKKIDNYHSIQRQFGQIVTEYKMTQDYQKLFDKYHFLPDYRPVLSQDIPETTNTLKLTNLK